MNKANAEKWAAALRSGEYTQGTGQLYRALHRPNKPAAYCCLGVACQVARANGVELDFHVDYGFPPSGEELPQVVQDWLGVDDSDPILVNDSCVTRNDGLNQSFATIAEAIETELYG
jgi:hypothetical protein